MNTKIITIFIAIFYLLSHDITLARECDKLAPFSGLAAAGKNYTADLLTAFFLRELRSTVCEESVVLCLKNVIDRLDTEFVINPHHGLRHAIDMLKTAVKITGRKEVNWKVLASAILLHDICADEEQHGRPGAKKAGIILGSAGGFTVQEIESIKNCIILHEDRTVNGREKREEAGFEACILYDCDQIEAFGYRGIYRYLAVYFGRGKDLNYIKSRVPADLKARYESLHFDLSERIADDLYAITGDYFSELSSENHDDDYRFGAAGIAYFIRKYYAEYPIEEIAVKALSSLKGLVTRADTDEKMEEFVYAMKFFLFFLGGRGQYDILNGSGDNRDFKKITAGLVLQIKAERILTEIKLMADNEIELFCDITSDIRELLFKAERFRRISEDELRIFEIYEDNLIRTRNPVYAAIAEKIKDLADFIRESYNAAVWDVSPERFIAQCVSGGVSRFSRVDDEKGILGGSFSIVAIAGLYENTGRYFHVNNGNGQRGSVVYLDECIYDEIFLERITAGFRAVSQQDAVGEMLKASPLRVDFADFVVNRFGKDAKLRIAIIGCGSNLLEGRVVGGLLNPHFKEIDIDCYDPALTESGDGFVKAIPQRLTNKTAMQNAGRYDIVISLSPAPREPNQRFISKLKKIMKHDAVAVIAPVGDSKRDVRGLQMRHSMAGYFFSRPASSRKSNGNSSKMYIRRAQMPDLSEALNRKHGFYKPSYTGDLSYLFIASREYPSSFETRLFASTVLRNAIAELRFAAARGIEFDCAL